MKLKNVKVGQLFIRSATSSSDNQRLFCKTGSSEIKDTKDHIACVYHDNSDVTVIETSLEYKPPSDTL